MASMKEQSIRVRKQDILRFVLGESGTHPIESYLDRAYSMDERYEVYDAFIYDSFLQERAVQGIPYISFVKEVDKLRKIILGDEHISKREIFSLCVELQEIAPASVSVPTEEDKKPMVEPIEGLAEKFGLDKIDTSKFADAKGTDESRALRDYEEEQKHLFGEEKEKGICWLGTIPECEKHRMRYPTREEMDEMMRQADEYYNEKGEEEYE